MNTFSVFAMALGIYLITSAILKFYGEDALAASIGMAFYNVFLSLYMLLAFTLGVIARRDRWLEKVNDYVRKWSNKIPLCNLWLLLTVCIIKCLIPTSAIDPFYTLAFIMLFLTIPLGSMVKTSISYIGKHSMNMWLIHTWICIRLFQTEVYGLKWPLLIYAVVLLLSLGVSHVIEWMYLPVKKFIK